MVNYIVKDDMEVIIEEKAKREMKKVVMAGLARIINRNCYKIDNIQDNGNEVVITVK